MPEDYGLFGPESVTWRVMGEPLTVVVGSVRAGLLQALHPRAMRGVAQNSKLLDPSESFARTLRTVEYVMVRTFGATPDVDRLARRVRKIHASLTAYDPDTESTYRLDEPDGLLWVHCSEVDSYLNVAMRAGYGLTAADADMFVREQRRAAELVGLDPAFVPGSVSSLAAYFTEMRPRVYATREAWDSLRYGPVALLPRVLKPLLVTAPAVRTLSFLTLPAWARRMYGVPGGAAVDRAVDLAVTAALRSAHQGTRVVPARIKYPRGSVRRAKELVRRTVVHS